MSKEYGIKFGTGALTATSGLSPTFINFVRMDTGGTLTPPGITSLITGLGLYKFNYQPSFPIYFEIDGATTGLGNNRYIQGVLDPNDRLDEFTLGLSNLIALYGQTNVALGTTNVAINTSLAAIGNSILAIGTSNYAWGNTNFALGTTAVALGISNYAWGSSNLALGMTNVALGTTNVALGNSNIALGTTSVALGVTGVALGTTTVALGITGVAIGTTIYSYVSGISGFALGIADLANRIGTTASSFGDTLVDPGTLYGFLRRTREFLEGGRNYTKSTGIMQYSSRGSSTLLVQDTMTETLTNVTRT